MPNGLHQGYMDYLYLYYAYLQELIRRGITTTEAAQIAVNRAYERAGQGVPVYQLPEYEQAKQWQQYGWPEEEQVPAPTTGADYAKPGGFGVRGGVPVYPGSRKPTVPAAPPITEAYYPFLEGMEAPSMQRWARGMMPQVYAEFEAEQPGARESWWSSKYLVEHPWKQWYPHSVLQDGVGMGPAGHWGMAYELKELGGEGRWDIKKRPDPWAEFLKNYPFAEKFMEQPPGERGFYPARYKPPTRWLTY